MLGVILRAVCPVSEDSQPGLDTDWGNVNDFNEYEVFAPIQWSINDSDIVETINTTSYFCCRINFPSRSIRVPHSLIENGWDCWIENARAIGNKEKCPEYEFGSAVQGKNAVIRGTTVGNTEVTLSFGDLTQSIEIEVVAEL